MARTVRDFGIVVLTAYNVDLLNVDDQIATGMMCPGDNAFVLDWTVQISSAGTGSGANHELVLEHGTDAAGVALTAQLDIDADGTAGLKVTGDGLGRPAVGGTIQGTKIQVNNVESAAISNGATIDILVRWQL